MKKHLFAIFTYFATFFISFFIVSLLTEKPQTKATSCFPTKSVMRLTHSFETEQQITIRNLLLLDREFGMDYFAGAEKAEDTKFLVGNMQSLYTSDLPAPVQEAYQAHIKAWDNYAKHLSKNHDSTDVECKILNRKINETYGALLYTAKNYDVDFQP
ncbi:hypothetical protein BH20ACI4_BH20ACI4_19440 [soil metagenome]